MSVRIFWPVPNLSWGITAASHDTHTEFVVVSQPPGLQDSLPTSRAGAQRGELDAHSGHPWLTIPNAISIVGLVSLTVALEVQVRFVEEPYLLTAQGDSYQGYARIVGRFAPGVGRIR